MLSQLRRLSQPQPHKPTEADDDGSVKPIRLNAPGLSNTEAPLLRPVNTSTLVDGKIVINKP